MSAFGGVDVLLAGGMRLACRASSRRRDRGTFMGAEAGLPRFFGSRVRPGRLCRGGCCRGCIVVAEFCVESLHLVHADIVRGTELQFMHGGGWVEVDVGEWAAFESVCHTLKYHFLVKVWCAKGSLTEAVDESPEHLVLFLSDANKRDGYNLM